MATAKAPPADPYSKRRKLKLELWWVFVLDDKIHCTRVRGNAQPKVRARKVQAPSSSQAIALCIDAWKRGV